MDDQRNGPRLQYRRVDKPDISLEPGEILFQARLLDRDCPEFYIVVKGKQVGDGLHEWGLPGLFWQLDSIVFSHWFQEFVVGMRQMEHHRKNRSVKEAGWAKYQPEIDKKYEQNPHQSYKQLCDKVGERFGVSYKTVDRHTEDPTKPT